jgi:apolipoprotein N-acyltransferase
MGRVVARTDFFTQAAITGTIAARRDVTWYGRFRDVFAWGCMVTTLLAVRRRRPLANDEAAPF